MKQLTQQICLATVLALGACGIAQAEEEGRRCREGSLDGLYIFSASGYTIVGGVAQPKAIVELIRFDGGGSLIAPAATRSINGVITQFPFNPNSPLGHYTLNPDCTGTVTFGVGGPSFDIFASPNGEDAWMIQNQPNTVFQGNVARVAR
jgi:hypothetical protein